MNRGNVTPQPQIGTSYLDPATPGPPAPPFPWPPGSTPIPLLTAAAGGPVTSYSPSGGRRPLQTWGTTIILPAMAA
jgi:hypothetical protein